MAPAHDIELEWNQSWSSSEWQGPATVVDTWRVQRTSTAAMDLVKIMVDVDARGGKSCLWIGVGWNGRFKEKKSQS